MATGFEARTNRRADGDLHTPTVVHVTGEIDIQHAGELELLDLTGTARLFQLWPPVAA